jgi:hypothetical protein
MDISENKLLPKLTSYVEDAFIYITLIPCGICGGQSGAGAGFLRVLRFPLPIFIPPIYPQSPSPTIRGWYNRPVVAAVTKVPPHKLQKKS